MDSKNFHMSVADLRRTLDQLPKRKSPTDNSTLNDLLDLAARGPSRDQDLIDLATSIRTGGIPMVSCGPAPTQEYEHEDEDDVLDLAKAKRVIAGLRGYQKGLKARAALADSNSTAWAGKLNIAEEELRALRPQAAEAEQLRNSLAMELQESAALRTNALGVIRIEYDNALALASEANDNSKTSLRILREGLELVFELSQKSGLVFGIACALVSLLYQTVVLVCAMIPLLILIWLIRRAVETTLAKEEEETRRSAPVQVKELSP